MESCNVSPYEPYFSSVEYALLEMPIISFDMNVARFVPITGVPVLRQYFFRIMTRDIPEELMIPNKMILVFTPQGIKERNDTSNESSPPEAHIMQRALFDLTDLNGDGHLSQHELFMGLKDWGYTAEDSAETFAFFGRQQGSSGHLSRVLHHVAKAGRLVCS